MKIIHGHLWPVFVALYFRADTIALFKGLVSLDDEPSSGDEVDDVGFPREGLLDQKEKQMMGVKRECY